MSITAPVKVAAPLITSQSNAAMGVTRATLDLRGKVGVLLTMKTVTGGTGPSVACTCKLYISHETGPTPAAGPAGADWKTIWLFSSGTSANNTIEHSQWIADVQHLQVEFSGNTGQAVSIEALGTVTTGYESV